MLGIYDYTVILTYLSAISAGIGILVSLNGPGHPYMGIFFLMICGICDTFDGQVARTKKNRTQMEQNFGIQIDSLSDLVAFGVLPACIGNAMIRIYPKLPEVPRLGGKRFEFEAVILIWLIMLLYMLAALIRLAYFNVTEEERQKTEGGKRKYYEGLPVTSSALIFPTVMLLQYITRADITILYFVAMLITGLLFISKFKIPKPGKKEIKLFILIGIVEFIILLFVWKYIKV